MDGIASVYMIEVKQRPENDSRLHVPDSYAALACCVVVVLLRIGPAVELHVEHRRRPSFRTRGAAGRRERE